MQCRTINVDLRKAECDYALLCVESHLHDSYCGVECEIYTDMHATIEFTIILSKQHL